MQPFSYKNTEHHKVINCYHNHKRNNKNRKSQRKKKRANKNKIPEIKELYRCGITKGVY